MKTNSRNYYIKESSGEDNSVELWSTKRLPFEPSGWLLEMRNSLFSEIKKLNIKNDSALYAIYSSKEKGFFDVENVLFYNVGAGAFKEICQNDLVFERTEKSPPEISQELLKSPNHYQGYFIMNKDQLSPFWKKRQTIASWSNVPCPPLKVSTKAEKIWEVMKKVDIQLKRPQSVKRFGMSVDIKAPEGTKTNLSSLVKPLLDGIISSFHSHEVIKSNETVDILSNRIGVDQSKIKEWLYDSINDVLGKRNLVYLFRNNIKWNPADDLCLTTSLHFDDSLDEENWLLSGEIFSI